MIKRRLYLFFLVITNRHTDTKTRLTDHFIMKLIEPFACISIRESEIIVVHRIFAFGRITLLSFQSLIPSPAIGKLSNHEWNRGDDFENKKADKIRKGVVGRIGRNAPTIPKTKLIQAKINQIGFTSVYRDLLRFFLELKVP